MNLSCLLISRKISIHYNYIIILILNSHVHNIVFYKKWVDALNCEQLQLGMMMSDVYMNTTQQYNY